MDYHFKYGFASLLNRFIPKERNSIFMEPHKNGRLDKQDVLNYSGDSVLTFLNFIISNNLTKDFNIKLVIYDESRVGEILYYFQNHNIVNIKLIKHFNCYTNFLKKFIYKLLYHFSKMRSQTWICATVHDNKRYNVPAQKLICLNYFSSFKSDFGGIDYDYLPKNWTLVCSTSMLDSIIQSAAFSIPYLCFQPLGLARNDVLFLKSSQKDKIINWIRTQTGKLYSKIIVFAPTFRDYEKEKTIQHNIWGYTDNSTVSEILKKNDAIVIAKLHAWQNVDAIANDADNIVLYEPNYQFTIYDVMVIADLLITDYSSIGLDFLLMGKPVIYNLYDKEKYLSTRGMSFEPMEEIFGGDIVENEYDLARSINSCLQDNKLSLKAKRVRNIHFKYQDGDTCKRIFDFLTEKGVF